MCMELAVSGRVCLNSGFSRRICPATRNGVRGGDVRSSCSCRFPPSPFMPLEFSGLRAVERLCSKFGSPHPRQRDFISIYRLRKWRAQQGGQSNGALQDGQEKGKEKNPFPVLWEKVTQPLIQNIQNIQGKTLFKTVTPEIETSSETAKAETKSYFPRDFTFPVTTSKGELAPAALDCIEQFSRLNGLTGKQMKANFESTAPPVVRSDEARNLVEFTCFRFLSRSNADFHPALKDTSFRRLAFSAMLAWQRPYKEEIPEDGKAKDGLPSAGFVGEEAFKRIAPAIMGAADRATAHFLYNNLKGQDEGLSFDVWDRYCTELCKVQKEREHLQQQQEGIRLELEAGERIICVGADTRQPVQKWSNGSAWPGRLTLTDRALYFEPNGLTHHQKATRMDLTGAEVHLERKKVGPFGVEIFDSAISVAPDRESEPWVLEFIDFSGANRRETWFAILKEILAVYRFIGEYGVKKDDPLVGYIYGAKHGLNRALSSAIMGISRLEALKNVVGTLPSKSENLLQFSYLENAPSGDLVLQAYAVSFWGGRMEVRSRDLDNLALSGGEAGGDDGFGLSENFVGTDGAVYHRNWAVSPTWGTGKSHAFWRSVLPQHKHKGIVLGKNHVVGGMTHVERAVLACSEQARLAEKTQATIDGALLKGVPSNVDLLKELLLPFSVVSVNLQKLRRWENPGATLAFLFIVYGIIYLNWLRYVFPALVLCFAGFVYALRTLKTSGLLGDDFGKVTIREQQPTNTIQKILALKEALNALEDFLQNSNITLLKLRTLVLSVEPRVTNEFLMVLVGVGLSTLLVPFRYLLALFFLDQFTAELKFREASVKRFFSYLRDWWNTIPASRVELLPPETSEEGDPKTEHHASKAEAVMQAMSEWLGEDSQISQIAGGSRSEF
ncbi:hypothetical protein R1sor_006482 [Riccia sorocarpa]|uniref:Reticulon-like protein n=1 Tax=Riccia sorocarpa TaxID=122646 RepID=A0ABD3HRS6_9MARC